jgi:hypothetical protein
MDRSPLDFERLDVYRCAIDFLALAVRISEHMARGHANLRDQLRRASTSTHRIDAQQDVPLTPHLAVVLVLLLDRTWSFSSSRPCAYFERRAPPRCGQSSALALLQAYSWQR